MKPNLMSTFEPARLACSFPDTAVRMGPVASGYTAWLINGLPSLFPDLDPMSLDRESLLHNLPRNDAQDGPDENHTDVIKICTWNVRGMSDLSKMNQVRSLLRTRRIDIVNIQETKWNECATADNYVMGTVFERGIANIQVNSVAFSGQGESIRAARLDRFYIS